MTTRAVPLSEDVLLGPGIPAIARHLKQPERVVRHLIDKGRIPAFKIGDDPRYWARESELAAVLTAATGSNKEPAKPPKA